MVNGISSCRTPTSPTSKKTQQKASFQHTIDHAKKQLVLTMYFKARVGMNLNHQKEPSGWGRWWEERAGVGGWRRRGGREDRPQHSLPRKYNHPSKRFALGIKKIDLNFYYNENDKNKEASGWRRRRRRSKLQEKPDVGWIALWRCRLKKSVSKFIKNHWIRVILKRFK